MPAIASALVHVSPETGIRMADFGLRGDEDFLLIHSVTDRAEYGDEKKVFNLAGKKIYHALMDPELTFSFDADCLALEGLANLHPGQNIGLSLLRNVMSGSFGFDISGTPWIMYRRPVRTRRAGNIAGINFDIVVSNVNIGSSQQIAITSWPNGATPANTLVNSSSPTPIPVSSMFGCTIFWRRVSTLPVSPVTEGNGAGSAAAVTSYYQGWPVGSTQPANLAAFLIAVDAYGDAESEIMEVYHVPSGTHWLTTGANRIPAMLLGPTDPRGVLADDDGYVCRYVARWLDHGLLDYRAEIYRTDYADLSAFLAATNSGDISNGSLTLEFLFDTKTNTYLHGP